MGRPLVVISRAQPPLVRLHFWLHVVARRGEQVAEHIATDACPWKDLRFSVDEALHSVDESAPLLDNADGASADSPSTRLRADLNSVGNEYGAYHKLGLLTPPKEVPKAAEAAVVDSRRWKAGRLINNRGTQAAPLGQRSTKS